MTEEQAGRREQIASGGVFASPLFWKLALVASALTWGFSFFVVKDAVEVMPTFQLLALRFMGAAVLMLAAFFGAVRAHLDRTTILVGVGMGVFEWAAYALQTFGIAETTAGKNAFLTGVYCIIVPFISYFAMGEKLTRYNVGAAVLCLAGIAFVALDNLSINRGDLLTLGGAVFYALQLVVAAKYGRTQDVNAMTFWMFLTMGVLSVACCAAFEEPLPLDELTPSLVLTIVFLSAICTCLLLVIMNQGLTHVPASTGSLLLSLESPSGVFFAAVFAHEALSARLLVGFALIFCSIVLSETHFDFLQGRLPRKQAGN